MNSVLERLRAHPDYALAVASGYTLTAVQMGVQLLLVPLYLDVLGEWQFGVLMMLLSFLNFVAIGVGWMSGGASRVLGEYAAAEDAEGFRHAYLVSRFIYTGYSLLVAAAILYAGRTFQTSLFGEEASSHSAELGRAALAAACYLVILYDLSVQRLALNALRRQASANILQMASVLTFVVLVVPWLLAGGGLAGIIVCLAAGAAVARLASAVRWWQARPYRGWRFDTALLLPLARRLAGPMGGGFLLYGMFLLLLQADVVIIGILGGAAAAAQFALVWRLAEVLVLLIWKLPEHLAPYLIHLDAGARHARLAEIYRQADRVLIVLSLGAGVFYAALGGRLVVFWVGAEHAPDDRWAFLLAGGAVFWLGIARLPAIFAYATVRLRALNVVAGAETCGKIALTLVLFPMLGHIAPLVAINVMHGAAIAAAYRRLERAPA
jgi:O-antigen/teichoic acid export membrane protein